MYRLLYLIKWIADALAFVFEWISAASDWVNDLFSDISYWLYMRIDIAKLKRKGIRGIYVKRVKQK